MFIAQEDSKDTNRTKVMDNWTDNVILFQVFLKFLFLPPSISKTRRSTKYETISAKTV